MRYKRIATSLLALTMLVSTIVPAYAAEANEVTDPLPGTGNTKLTLEVKESSSGGGTEPDNPDNPDIPPVDPTDIIIATVPVELPIVMNLEGEVTVPTDAKIINHSTEKGIKVASININLSSDWTATDFNEDFTTKAQDTKEIGLSLRGDKLQADGSLTVTEGSWNIGVDNNLPLNMQAKLPKQSATSKTQLANIGFTIDWSGTTEGSDPSIGTEGNTTPDESLVTVTFTTDGNGMLEGNTEAKINSGEPAPFPTAKPSSIRYEHTGWVDATTNAEVEPTTPITSDTTIKAVFSERAASPKNWFTSSNGTITGLSDEYLNMVDAPTDLVIPNNIGGSTIKSIGANAFANKDLITSVVIPNTITTLNNGIFKECNSLEAISIPSGVTSLPNNLFYNCTSLKSVEIPNTVTQIAANTFSGCTALKQLKLEYSKPYRIQNSPFGLTEDKITWGQAESWDTNPISISKSETLKLKLDSNTSTIKALSTSISGELNIPTSIDGIKVTKIGDFSNCVNLVGISIPDSVTTIDSSAFSRCINLENIDIPDSIENIGAGAFRGCTSLTNIRVGFGNLNYISENGVLFNKDKTTLIKYPVGKIDTSYIIPDSVTLISSYAFDSGINLTNLTISSKVESIERYAIYNCTNLASVDIPNSVTTIGTDAFYSVPHIIYSGTATGRPWGAKSIN